MENAQDERNETPSSGSSSLSPCLLSSPSSLEPTPKEEKENLPVLPPPKEKDAERVSPSSQTDGELPKPGGFMPMPYFAGPEHGIEWLPISKKNGELQPPVLIDSGLLASSLAHPTMTYIDPELAPKTDEEWHALWRQSFDDLAMDPSIDAKRAKAAYEHRVAVERMMIHKEATRVIFRPRWVDEENPDREIYFQFRYANKNYALATCVTSSDKVDAIYKSIADQAAKNDLSTLDQDIKKEITKAATTKECDRLLKTLHVLKQDYEGKLPDKAASLKCANAWLELCIAKRTKLARIEDEPKDQDVSEDDEEEEKEAFKGEMRPCHTIGSISYRLCEDNVLPLDFDQTVPLPNPTFAPYPLCKPGGDPSGETRFDWITDHKIMGKLFSVATLPTSSSTNEWRNLKTNITIPCSMDACEKEVLVVDHERITILSMPSGKPTGEVYFIVAPSEKETNFKMVNCSLTKDHILVSGFRRGQDVASLFVIHRKLDWVTIYNTDVPLASAILSSMVPGTMLLGFSEGSLLRCRLPTKETLKSAKQHVMIFPPVHPETLKVNLEDSSEENKKRSLDVQFAIKSAIRKQRKALGARAVVESIATTLGEGAYQDWVMHVGNANAVTRIVEHGRRIVCSTCSGLHLFKNFGLVPQGEDRRVTMKLMHNASFEFYGNHLVIQKTNNAMQIVQLHTLNLEVTLDPPTILKPVPPEQTVEVSSISIHDQMITIVHGDGTRRIVTLDSKYAPLPIPPAEPVVVETKTKGKKKKNNKGKGKK